MYFTSWVFQECILKCIDREEVKLKNYIQMQSRRNY